MTRVSTIRYDTELFLLLFIRYLLFRARVRHVTVRAYTFHIVIENIIRKRIQQFKIGFKKILGFFFSIFWLLLSFSFFINNSTVTYINSMKEVTILLFKGTRLYLLICNIYNAINYSSVPRKRFDSFSISPCRIGRLPREKIIGNNEAIRSSFMLTLVCEVQGLALNMFDSLLIMVFITLGTVNFRLNLEKFLVKVEFRK